METENSIDKRLDFIIKNFPSVKEDDIIITDISCSLQKDGVIQGRLYLSYYGYYFHSKILGFVTTVMNYWHNVYELKKDNAAFVLPIVIHILSQTDKHSFSFMGNRDRIYTLCHTIWQNQLLPEPMSKELMAEQADSIMQSSVNQDFDESPNSVVYERETKLIPSKSVDPIFSPVFEVPKALSDTLSQSIIPSTISQSKAASLSSTTSLVEKHIIEPPPISDDCTCSHEEFKCIYTYNTTSDLETLRTLIFDESSPILAKLAEILSLQNFNIKKVEELSIMTYLHPMGFPFQPVSTETSFKFYPHQIWDKPHCWVLSTSFSHNAMFADSFKVLIKYCFTAKDDGICINIYFKVDYTKKVIAGVKAVIYNRSLAKTEEYVSTLFKLLTAHVKESASPIEGISSSEFSSNNGYEKLDETKTTSILPKKSVSSITLDYLVGMINTIANFTTGLDIDIKSLFIYVMIIVFLHFHIRIVNEIISLIKKQNILIESLKEIISKLDPANNQCPK